MRRTLSVSLIVLSALAPMLVGCDGGSPDNPSAFSSVATSDSPSAAPTPTATVTQPGPTVTATVTETAKPHKEVSLDLPDDSYSAIAHKNGKGSRTFSIGVSGTWTLLWAYKCPADVHFTVFVGGMLALDNFGILATNSDSTHAKLTPTVSGRTVVVHTGAGCRWWIGAAK